MPVIRAFIAIDLCAPIQEKIAAITNQLQKTCGPAVHWVPAKNIHLTLKFLGDVSPTNLDLLKKIIASESARQKTFELTISGLGAFPSPSRPRVIWVGVQAPPTLMALERGIEAETQRLGYTAEDRPFSPHLTLGRVTHNANPQEVRQVAEGLQKMQVGDLGSYTVDVVKLFRSDLQPGGAVYTPLFASALKTG